MTMNRMLPERLVQRLQDFAARHAELAPGALTGIVVTGSAIAGDWWPGSSDIDAVFIVARPFTEHEADAVARLHRETVSAGPIDGVYLTEEQLAAGPDAVATAPQVVEGEFGAERPGAQLTWITWREVEAGAEATVAGDGTLGEWQQSARRVDGADRRARDFSRRNLHEYWAPLVADVTEQLSGRPDDAEVNADTLKWIALGPARLVATAETGGILSKSAAAAYASERWPAYAPLLRRAVASRAGESVSFTAADAREALELARECIRACPAAN